jgi:hypothetical protein
MIRFVGDWDEQNAYAQHASPKAKISPQHVSAYAAADIYSVQPRLVEKKNGVSMCQSAVRRGEHL